MKSNFIEEKFGVDNVSYQNQLTCKESHLPSLEGKKLSSFGSDNNFLSLIKRYFQEQVEGTSPHTVKAKAEDLKKFIIYYQGLNAHLDAGQWLPRDTVTFVRELESQSYRPSSINRILATLKTFSRWLINEGVLSKDPCRGVKSFQLEEFEPKRVTDLQYHRILKACELLNSAKQAQYSQHKRNIALILLLNNSGLRIGEALSLKLNQFKPMGKILTSVKCKGGKIRNIKISKEVTQALEEYLKEERIPGSDYVFTNRYGQHLSRNGVAKALNKIVAIAHAYLPHNEHGNITPHQFRHRCAYKARELKGDVWAAKRLGHSSMNHIERYASLDSRAEDSLIERL